MVMPDRDVPHLRRHRLDDDPLGVKDIVDNSSENLTARLNDNDEPIRAIASPQLKLFLTSISGSSLCRSLSREQI